MKSKDFLQYNTTGAQLYSVSQFVDRVTNCNGFTAINTGTSIVTVNDMVLNPGTPGNAGESITIGGNQGEIYVGTIRIAFPAGAVGPQVAIIQKFYVGCDK